MEEAFRGRLRGLACGSESRTLRLLLPLLLEWVCSMLNCVKREGVGAREEGGIRMRRQVLLGGRMEPPP
jgi:hypothetical protein